MIWRAAQVALLFFVFIRMLMSSFVQCLADSLLNSHLASFPASGWECSLRRLCLKSGRAASRAFPGETWKRDFRRVL